MNIAIIHPSQPGDSGSGASIHITKIISALQSRGHEITVFYAQNQLDINSSKENVSYKKLDLDGYPYQAHLQWNKTVRNNLDEFANFDVVHTHPTATIPGIAQVGAKTDTSTIATLHSYTGICPKVVNQLQYMDYMPCKSNGVLKCSICALGTLPSVKKAGDNLPFRITGRAARIKLQYQARKRLNEIDQFHVLSPHMKEKYIEFGFPGKYITVIPDMVDDQFFIDHQSNFVEPYRILSVGRLRKRKGAHKLVPLLHKLHNEFPYLFELTIIGDGTLRTKIEQQMRQFGLERHITIKGQVDNEDLPGIYAKHDIFLYPGEFNEPFGIVFLEAIATGTPVISTDIGSVEEIIQDGGIVTKNNIESLSESIVNIISNDKLPEMSKESYKRAKDFRQELIVNEFEKMYMSVTE